MPRPLHPSFSDSTGKAVVSGLFELLRPRLIAMVERRVGLKLALRIDPEGVVQDAFLRAQIRWASLDPKPKDPVVWVFGQVHDRLVEQVRSALGSEQNVDQDVPWPSGSAAPLAEHLVDSHTGASTAMSRAERSEVMQAALERLDSTDREILALRYFEGMNFAQIGAILGLSQNNANKRAIRAMIQLRGLIPPEFRPARGTQP
jgi:RNA polymerase sigma-70 factor (ECF subfamily)